MNNDSKHHPVRRIREALKKTSPESGLREFGSSTGFAALIERASSTVRNVESGHTKKWDRLAGRIEEITGVSAAWILSNPKPSDPIPDVEGKPWDPERFLDHLGGAAGFINWRVLMTNSPASVVELATHLVQRKLSEDLIKRPEDGEEASTSFLSDLAKIFGQHGCLDSKDVSDMVVKTMIGHSEQIIKDLVQAAIHRR